MNTTANLLDLDPIVSEFAAAAAKLEEATAALEADLAAVRDRHTPRIKPLVEAEAALEAQIRTWIEAHPEAFEKPRTQTISGVEVGLKAVPGTVVFEDEPTVIANLRRMFRDEPDVLRTLIKVEESVRKDALRALPADKFSRAGCRIEGAGDLAVVRRTTGDFERLLKTATATLVKALVDQGGEPAKKPAKRTRNT